MFQAIKIGTALMGVVCVFFMGQAVVDAGNQAIDQYSHTITKKLEKAMDPSFTIK